MSRIPPKKRPLSSTQRPPVDALLGSYMRKGEKAYIHLCWMLHGFCNHRCSYCDEYNWGGKLGEIKLEDAIQFCEKFLHHYQTRRIIVSFSGGEPSLWRDFMTLVRWLHERQIPVGLTSNGSRGAEYFKQLAPLLTWLNLSYHPEFSRDDRFLETVRVCSQSCQTTIRLMMPPERHLWNRSFQFGEKLKDLQGLGSLTTIEYVPIVEEFSRLHPQPVKYEEDQKEQFQQAFFYAGPKKVLRTRPPVEDVDAGFLGPPVQISEFDVNSLLSEVKNNFIGWKCDIGLEQIFVDSHGTVLRAGCRVGGKIGHISDAIIKFPLKAVRCTKTYCHCGTDIVVTKVSPEWELAQNLNRERKIPLVGVNTLKSYGVYFCALVFPYITKFVKYRLIPGSINLIKRILGPRLTHFLRYGIWPWLCDLPLIRFLRFGLRPWIADFPVRRVFRVFVPPWKIHLMELLKKESKQKPSA